MGRTPFHYAAICNDGGQYYELLEKNGADANVSDDVRKSLQYMVAKAIYGSYHVLTGNSL
jgi:ankyrin repeat protein